MTTVKWSTPGTRSSNIASTVMNSLATGSESTVVTYDNSSGKNLYATVTTKLGSITPSTGGSISLRVTVNDGFDTADKANGDLYTSELLTGASAKIVIMPLVRLYPYSLRFSIINNSGVTLASAGNELYVTPFNEEAN